MVRHISVFTFKDGPDKQQNIEAVRTYLEGVPAMYPAIKAQYIGVPAAETPELPEDAPVMFGDLIQVADYEDPEAAARYAETQAHIKLAEFSTCMLKKVTVMDFEV